MTPVELMADQLVQIVAMVTQLVARMSRLGTVVRVGNSTEPDQLILRCHKQLRRQLKRQLAVGLWNWI